MARHTRGLLIVVALVVGSWPAALVGGISLDPQGESCSGADDVCCEGEASDAGSQSEDEGCCPAGCDDCYLACCAGIISVLPPVMVVTSSQKAVSIISMYHGDPSPGREREIDHPPRA